MLGNAPFIEAIRRLEKSSFLFVRFATPSGKEGNGVHEGLINFQPRLLQIVASETS